MNVGSKQEGKHMTKRDNELAIARIAGYHEDKQRFTRLVIERRCASYQALNEAWRIGVKQKQAGMKCSCYSCKQ